MGSFFSTFIIQKYTHQSREAAEHDTQFLRKLDVDFIHLIVFICGLIQAVLFLKKLNTLPVLQF